MPTWSLFVVAYFAYLTGLSAFLPMRGGRWRVAPLAACACLPALWFTVTATGMVGLAGAVVMPSLFLVASYWLSGLFFTRPMPRVEEALLRGDRWLMPRLGLQWLAAHGPRWVLELLELSYLLVYPMVPAGALTLALAGRGDELPRYWAVTFAATLPCYAMLPWLQTRPPRALEAAGPLSARNLWLRRLSLTVLRLGSHQANTVPSGHAAGAFATALAVASVLPVPGAAFLVLATMIAVATVVGRYHYAIDTLLGVAVAFAAWVMVGG
jgi:hypothetical protein